MGSPPHVRGKLALNRCLCVLKGITPEWAGKPYTQWEAIIANGITPACAGKTGSICIICNAIRDHPRMCGENAYLGTFVVDASGSPPHVRGKQIQILKFLYFFGITPACAGKTTK